MHYPLPMQRPPFSLPTRSPEVGSSFLYDTILLSGCNEEHGLINLGENGSELANEGRLLVKIWFKMNWWGDS